MHPATKNSAQSLQQTAPGGSLYQLGEMGRPNCSAGGKQFFSPSLSEPQALGCGCVAQTVLSRGALGGALMISVGFAMAVTLAIYVAGGISGKPAFATHRFGKRRGGRRPHSCSWSFSPLLRRSALPSPEGPKGSKGWGAVLAGSLHQSLHRGAAFRCAGGTPDWIPGWGRHVWHTKDEAASEGIS